MRLPSGKRLGQSGYELALAVFLSFFLHAGVIFATLFFYFWFTPKTKLPLFYEVKLVGLPEEKAPAEIPAAASALAKKAEEPRTAVKPRPKAPKAAPKQRTAAPKPVTTALNKGALPDLTRQKPKPAQHEASEPAPSKPQQAAAPQTPSAAAAPATGAAEKVAMSGTVSTPSGEFKFAPFYMGQIKKNIENNWNPPPGTTGLKAKVVFRLLRSGKVFGDARIEEASGNTYFDLAARRAVLQSRFPPMPDDFFQEYAVFSVDLQAQE